MMRCICVFGAVQCIIQDMDGKNYNLGKRSGGENEKEIVAYHE